MTNEELEYMESVSGEQHDIPEDWVLTPCAKKLVIPMWFPTGNGTNPLWREGWDSCLEEITKRLESAGVPYEMETEFGKGRTD